MKVKFDISVDAKRSLVRMTMSGFFTAEVIRQFVIARDKSHNMLQCRINEHLTLVDIRKMDIQAQDSVVAFQRVLADLSKSSKLLEFVVTRSFFRM